MVVGKFTEYTKKTANGPRARSVTLTGDEFNFMVNDERPNRIHLNDMTAPNIKDDGRHRAQQNMWSSFLHTSAVSASSNVFVLWED